MPTTTPQGKLNWEDKVQQAQGYSEIVMAIAAGVGFISCFLPAVTIDAINVSAKVIAGWQGKLGFLGYIAVGVMALQMMKHRGAPVSRKKLIACLAVSGVVAIMTVLLMLDVPSLEGISKGFGLWVNILAGFALLAGSALKAKQEKLF